MAGFLLAIDYDLRLYSSVGAYRLRELQYPRAEAKLKALHECSDPNIQLLDPKVEFWDLNIRFSILTFFLDLKKVQK